MSENAIKAAEYVAEQVVNALGGYGLFGVELFVKGDKVIFNEVSPRPHDTGMVTLISQELSEFALHVRAFSVYRLVKSCNMAHQPLRRSSVKANHRISSSVRLMTP